MVRRSRHPSDRATDGAAQAVKGRSLLADARRRLFRNKAAVVSMALLALIALMAVFAPLLSPYAYHEIGLQHRSPARRSGGRAERALPGGRRPLVRHRCDRPRSLRARRSTARACRSPSASSPRWSA